MSDASVLNLEPGQVVGGYTLITRLGSGAMGSVWRVRDDGNNEYAMKILRDSLNDEQAGTSSNSATKAQLTARERLRREALALQKIRHPGVCNIVDMELDDALAFIVTTLIEGKNLREDVALNGRYTHEDLERLSAKLMDAVQAVHDAGIVHRDIKPTNVMVSATGPVLVDFGIAMGEGESHVTRTGLVMGTPGFIAPEVIDGAESSERTDWWSVASVLAFAATGKPVFGTQPMMAVLEREASGNANLTGLPSQTMQAFRAALEPDPARRCGPGELFEAIRADAMMPSAESADEEGMLPFEFIDPQTRVMNENSTVPLADTSPRNLWSDTVDNETTLLTRSFQPLTLPFTQQPPGYSALEPRGYDSPTSTPSFDVVDVKKNAYLSRGNIPVLLLAPIFAILAASLPLLAVFLECMTIWLFLIFGCNATMQLKREAKRGGERKSSDAAVRIVSLPWHIVKAFFLTIPKLLIFLILLALTTVCVNGIAKTQTTTASVELLGKTLLVPLPTPSPLSTVGLVFALSCAFGWFLNVWVWHSAELRIGAGVMVGLSAKQQRVLADRMRDDAVVILGETGTENGIEPIEEPARTGKLGKIMVTVCCSLLLILAIAELFTLPELSWIPSASYL